MSERERWIVYPLLFLALGVALRDKLIDQTMSKRIVCERLTIVGDDRANRRLVPLIELGAAERSSSTDPLYGEMQIDGRLKVQQLEAGKVSADNYFFRRLPMVPNVLRAIPGVSAGDWLRAFGERAAALGADAESSAEADATVAPPESQPSGEESP